MCTTACNTLVHSKWAGYHQSTDAIEAPRAARTGCSCVSMSLGLPRSCKLTRGQAAYLATCNDLESFVILLKLSSSASRHPEWCRRACCERLQARLLGGPCPRAAFLACGPLVSAAVMML